MPAELKTKAVKRADDRGSQPPMLQRWKRFMTEVRTEMRKVTVPSMKEVRATTAVVIITTFLFAAYFYVVDKGIGALIDAFLRWVKG